VHPDVVASLSNFPSCGRDVVALPQQLEGDSYRDYIIWGAAPDVASRSDAGAHLWSKLIEFLMEAPGTPVLLMALKVPPSRIPASAHRALAASSGSAEHVLCVLSCGSLPRVRYPSVGKRIRAPTTVLTPGLAVLLALKDRRGMGDITRSLARQPAPVDHEALHAAASYRAMGSELLPDFLLAST
jgi:hypothetical protein